MDANLARQLAEKDAENARLRDELARLRNELGRVLDQLGIANGQISELTKKIGDLSDAMARGNDRIAELLVIARRKKSGTPPPAEKVAPPPPLVGPDAKEAFEKRPVPPPAPGLLHDRPRPKQRPTGRKPLPPGLPTDETTVYPDRCACGCEAFDWINEVVEEKLDVRSHQRRRLTHRKTGRCRKCNVRTTAEAPPSPFERSKVSCEWLAWFIVQKFLLLVPLDRVRRYLGAQGIVLAESFLVSQVEAAAELLDAIDGEHWKDLLDGDRIATDGTGFKVQIPGVGLHHGFIETYHRDHLVVFQYEAEKGGETQAAKLAKFAGALLVDSESRYNETTRSNPLIVEYNCNAHPRRKMKDAEAAQPFLAVEGGRFISAMFESDADAAAAGLEGDARLTWRQERIKPIIADFRRWIEVVQPTLTPGDPLAKVLQYYLNHWTELTRFVDNPYIPLDNSASEREFQSVAKLRLNCLFAGGTEGAHRACVLLGIVATCRRLKVDCEAYLTWAFIRRGTHRGKYAMSAADLTPAAYKRTLAAA